MIINEKELKLDIKEMLETYNGDIEFTEAQLEEILSTIYEDVVDSMYQASSDVVIDYSNRFLNKG